MPDHPDPVGTSGRRPRRTAPDSPEAVDTLVEQVAAGRPRAVARMISIVENDAVGLRRLLDRLGPRNGHAHVVGLTGPPGVGKSTSTSALITAMRRDGLRVGVLAIDPSSPFTGGAVLGDRVRMQEHAGDREVFIRSMATRGHLGGLSAAATQAARVLDLAGCDVTVIETVGVGQSEIDIARACDTTVVLLAPGMGDGVQAAKAGILEIGDVFVVNKADRDGAQPLVRELRTMIGMTQRTAEEWRPPIIKTVASRGDGIDELWERIQRHRTSQEASGGWAERRLARSRAEVSAIVLDVLRRRLDGSCAGELDAVAARVRDGGLDPYTAAEELLDQLAGASGSRIRAAESVDDRRATADNPAR